MACEYGLTTREGEVLTLIAKGYSRSAISERLVLSPETVKSYANKMYGKIDLHSRQDLIDAVLERMKHYDPDAADALKTGDAELRG